MWTLKLSPLWNIMSQVLIFVAEFKFLFSRLKETLLFLILLKCQNFAMNSYRNWRQELGRRWPEERRVAVKWWRAQRPWHGRFCWNAAAGTETQQLTIKPFLSASWGHTGWVQMQLHSFRNSELDACKWSPSRFGSLATGTEPHYPLKYSTLLIGTWWILNNAVFFSFIGYLQISV